jgi:hypothetical protein
MKKIFSHGPIAWERVGKTRFHGDSLLETSRFLGERLFIGYGKERCFPSVRLDAI